MTLEIQTITTPLILNITVNCYLIKTSDGFVLIDTAKAGQRKRIEQELKQAGCKPGDLKLIILTHGDFDHCGNAAYIRETYGAPIMMHSADIGMVEEGDMFSNRNQPNPLIKSITGLLFHLSKEDRFEPDFYLQEGDDLVNFGFDAQVIELPGHSRGSIGLLTADGDLFCGDLMGNVDHPQIWSIMDNPDVAQASVNKLMHKPIRRVYPGHGKPFMMGDFIQSQEPESTWQGDYEPELQPTMKFAESPYYWHNYSSMVFDDC